MHESRPEQQQLFERSEFLIDTSRYTYLVCIRTFSKNDFPFDEIYRRLLLFTRADVPQFIIPGMYSFIRQWVVVRMIPTFRPRNSCIAICLLVSLVGGGTHDTYVPPKKQLYRYLFIRQWVVVSHERSARGRTRLTTVTSISCRSLQRQLLYLYTNSS